MLPFCPVIIPQTSRQIKLEKIKLHVSRWTQMVLRDAPQQDKQKFLSITACRFLFHIESQRAIEANISWSLETLY